MPKAPTPSLANSTNGQQAPPDPSRKRVSEVYKRVAIKFYTNEDAREPFFTMGIPSKGDVSTAELDWNGDTAAHMKAVRLLKHCRTLDIVLDTWDLPSWVKQLDEFRELETALASVTGVYMNTGAPIPFHLPKLKRLVRSMTMPESFPDEAKQKVLYALEPSPLPASVRTVAYMVHLSKGVLDRAPVLTANGLADSPGVKQVYFQFDGDISPPTPDGFVKGSKTLRMLFFLMGSIGSRVGKMNITFLWRDRIEKPEDCKCTPPCSTSGQCPTCTPPDSNPDFFPDSSFMRTALIALTTSVEWFRKYPGAWGACDTGEFYNDGPLLPGVTDDALSAIWTTRISNMWGTVEAAARAQKLDIRSFSSFERAKEERLMPWPASGRLVPR